VLIEFAFKLATDDDMKFYALAS